MRLETVASVLVKDLKNTLRSREVLFWSIVFPLMLLTVIVVIFAPRPEAPPPAKIVKVYIVAEPGNETVLEVAKYYEMYMNNVTTMGAGCFDAKVINASLSKALETLKGGDVDAVVYLDRSALEAYAANLTIKAKVYVLTGTPDPTGERMTMLSLSWFFNASANYVTMCAANYTVLDLVETLKCAPLNPRVYRYLDALSEAARGLTTSLGTNRADPKVREYLDVLNEASWGLAALLREAPLNPSVASRAEALRSVLSRSGRNVDVEWVAVRPRGAERESEIRQYAVGWMTLSVVFMMFMFNGILGAASSVSVEFDGGYMRRLLSTSVEPMELYIGKIAATMIVNAMTAVIVLLWGVFALGGRFTHGLVAPETVSVAAIMAVAALLAMSMGVLIGLLVRSPEAAMLAANAIIWPTMMLGGFWFPKFMLPAEVRWFADANPFSNLMYAVVEISCYGRSIGAYAVPVAVTVVLTAALLAASTLLYRKSVVRMVEG